MRSLGRKINKILCVGDSRIDIVVSFGDMKKNMFSGGICTSQIRLKPGGTVSNCAAMLSKLGANVSFLGLFAEGEGGQFLIDDLNSCGVSTMHSARRGNGLFPVIVAVGEDGNQISDALFLPGIEYCNMLKEDFREDIVDSFDLVHICGANIVDGDEASVGLAEFAEKCRENHDVLLTIDLNLRIESKGPDDIKTILLKRAVDAADVVLGSGIEEFEEVTGINSLYGSAEYLMQKGKTVVARDGKNPVIFADEGTIKEIPVTDVVPVNTIGAGDSFDAAFIRALCEGLTPEEAVRCGNICAGYTISHEEFRSVPKFEDIVSQLKI